MSRDQSPTDDAFHAPSDDPWWTETLWYSWNVPERGLLGYVYPVFRPNLGVQFGGVVVFGPDDVPPWEEPVHAFDWHQPMTPGLDLRDARLASGLHLQVHDPGRAYSVAWSGREASVELSVTAVGPALVTRTETPPLGAGHIDQMCHVTGSMQVRGEHIVVDCLSLRDRAWGPRPDGRQPRVWYAWGAASRDHYFLAAGAHRDVGDTAFTGFHTRDGVWARVTSGERVVERDASGRVSAVRVSARDELGRALSAVGTARPRHLFQGYPSMICWTGLVDWHLDGVPATGEDQDVWSPRGWRDHVRSAR